MVHSTIHRPRRITNTPYRVTRGVRRSKHPGDIPRGHVFRVGVRYCAPVSDNQVCTTVSGVSDIDSMPCSTSHDARSGWSDGP